MLKSHPRDAKWLTAQEQQALSTAIAREQAEREAAGNAHLPITKLLKDPQIVLFCLLYFAIQLTIYAATFWLPTIIRKMGGLSDFQVGLYNAVPWLIAMFAMYCFAMLSAKWRFQQAWLALALVIAACGLFASTSANPVFSFVAVLAAAAGIPRCTRRRGRDRVDQLRRQPGRLFRAGGVRLFAATHGLHLGRSLRAGDCFDHCGRCRVFRERPVDRAPRTRH
jgi:hypothetical protein